MCVLEEGDYLLEIARSYGVWEMGVGGGFQIGDFRFEKGGGVENQCEVQSQSAYVGLRRDKLSKVVKRHVA
jgi:hypothetical protein